MSKIRPPRMRMARKIKKGDVIKIKVKFNHPSFTGLGRADPDKEPSFNRALSQLHLFVICLCIMTMNWSQDFVCPQE